MQEVRDLGDIVSDIIKISINSSVTGEIGMISQLLYIASYLLEKPESK